MFGNARWILRNKVNEEEGGWNRYTRNTIGITLRKRMKRGDIFETLSIEDTVGYR
jgi:hypothetical protein